MASNFFFGQILSSFDRNELLQLSRVASRFNVIIKAKFPRAPFLRLIGISFRGNEWTFGSAIYPAPTFQFIRFNFMHLCLDKELINPTEMLQTVSHSWIGAHVTVILEKDVSMLDFSRSIATCATLNLFKRGIAILEQQPLIDRIDINEEHLSIPTLSQLMSAANLLFLPAQNGRKIRAKTRSAPPFDVCLQVIENVKKKFVNSAGRDVFKMQILYVEVMVPQDLQRLLQHSQNVEVCHAASKRKLRFQCEGDNFKLSTFDKHEDSDFDEDF